MNILSAENLSKSYGEKVLFRDLTIGIGDTDKIGLIGINGTGKSTLLRVLAGLTPPDKGSIVTGNKVRIDFLPQNPVFEGDSTVLQQVFNSEDSLMRVLYEYHQVLGILDIDAANKSALSRLNELSLKIDEAKAWEIEANAKMVLTKLGITDFSQSVKNLSGGQRKRIALARALISPSDLLILDEPTNHIDNQTLEWLEQYLIKRKGALLLITHDRYFLERVVNHIWELDKERIYFYPGNYSQFLETKAQREEQELAIAAKHKSLLRQELAWMRKGAKARTTKQKARIGRFEALQEMNLDTDSEELEIKVSSKRLGKKVLELTGVSKSYEGRILIDNFNLLLQPGDRLGIIGPNGSGKSTLLNIIGGVIQPDSGEVTVGPTVKLAYYDQESLALKGQQRVIDYIKEVAEVIRTVEGEVITAAQMLERFLFPGYLQWSYVEKLSGGEKRRLYLLRQLMSEPNVLLLDEPTNDLDIKTLTILEDYLDHFPGVVLIVSHDRYFLDRTVNRLLAFEGLGTIKSFVGNYSDYQEARKFNLDSPSQESIAPVKKEKEAKETKTKTKFSYKEQQEFDEIEGVIARLEEALAVVKEKIAHSSKDYLRLQELTQEETKLEEELSLRLDRWAELTEMAEEFERLKTKR